MRLSTPVLRECPKGRRRSALDTVRREGCQKDAGKVRSGAA